MKQQIINLIRENRISTTEVADVLGKKGQIPNVYALNEGIFCAGEVAFVYALNNSNWEVHEQLKDLDLLDKIVYVYCINCNRAIFGDLVSKYILLYKKARAIVVGGLVRDAHTLKKEKYPIWCAGVSPIGCVNVKNEKPIDTALLLELKEMYDGGVMVCDDSGVVFVPKNKLNAEFVEKLNFIEFQEDVWFLCLDSHKMSTYDIVCQKKYLKENGLLTQSQLEKLSEFSTEK